MKRHILFLFSLAFLTVTNSLFAQGTAFTYQGRLQSGGGPANGNYDFTFALYNNSSTNTPQLGATLTDTNVGVTNGLFTVTLDFGSVFTGNATWLSIAVRTNGGAGFTALSPLQELTPTPYATYAPNAGTAANVTGSIALSQLPGTVVTNGETGVNVTGTFTGNGAGLTNLAASALVGSGTLIAIQTNVYSSNGTYTFTVPSSTTSMVVKLWGAGGGADTSFRGGIGGAGAFSAVTLSVTPGQTYTVVVGRAGNNGGGGGGAGSGDAEGGSGNSGGGGGGQASSLFLFNGTNYIMEAVAGAGGGGGLISSAGAGGNPGEGPNGSGPGGGYNGNGGGNGSSYASAATNTGEPSLSLMGGSGGNWISGESGGGGGGYGGGSGGSVDGAGSGGGSYGTQIIGGNFGLAANTSDPDYISPAGRPQKDGLAVVIFSTPATVFAGVQAQQFIGSGASLTSLNASQLTSGTIPLAQLPSTVAFLNSNQTFTGQNSFAGIFARGGPPGSTGVNNNGYAFSGNGGDDDSGMFSLGDGQIEFYNNANEVMRIINGSVGIGTTSPSSMLEVAGTAQFDGNVGIGTASPSALLDIKSKATSAGGIRLEDPTDAGFWNITIDPSGDALVFSFTNRWPGIGYAYLLPSSAGLITTSDRRVKKDIAAMGPCLDRVMALKPSTFRYKTSDEGTPVNYGFIAQDIEEQFPDLVLERNGLKTLVGDGITAINTRAIQDLNQKLEDRSKELENENAELKKQNDLLAARFHDLETMVKALAEKK